MRRAAAQSESPLATCMNAPQVAFGVLWSGTQLTSGRERATHLDRP